MKWRYCRMQSSPNTSDRLTWPLFFCIVRQIRWWIGPNVWLNYFPQIVGLLSHLKSELFPCILEKFDHKFVQELPCVHEARHVGFPYDDVNGHFIGLDTDSRANKVARCILYIEKFSLQEIFTIWPFKTFSSQEIFTISEWWTETIFTLDLLQVS